MARKLSRLAATWEAGWEPLHLPLDFFVVAIGQHIPTYSEV